MFILLLINICYCIPKIEIYMESMCSDTTRFINNSLKNAAIDRIDELVQITFIPNGKQGLRQPSKVTDFSCQHGEVECYANMIESCALEYIESTKEKIVFLACFQEDARKTTAQWIYQLDKCVQEELRSKIQGCLHGPEGIEVQNSNRMKTPKNIEYIPSFKVDGQLKHQFQDIIQKNLLVWACKQNKGNNIQECEEYNL